MTPRRMMALRDLALARVRRDRAEELSLARLAAHGEADDVKTALEKLSR